MYIKICKTNIVFMELDVVASGSTVAAFLQAIDRQVVSLSMTPRMSAAVRFDVNVSITTIM